MRCDKPLDYLMMDEKCFRTYRPIYSQCLAITFGKFTFDFILQMTLTLDFSPLGMQMIFHHVVGNLCFIITVLGGFAIPMHTHIVMICEFS